MIVKLLSTTLSAGVGAAVLVGSLWTLAPTSTMRTQHRLEPLMDNAPLVSPDVEPAPEWGLVVTPTPSS